MSDYCDILEDTVLSTSTPITNVGVVAIVVATAGDSIEAGIGLTLQETISTTSIIEPASAYQINDLLQAIDSIQSGSNIEIYALTSRARATSRAILGWVNDGEGVVRVTDVVFESTSPDEIIDIASAKASVFYTIGDAQTVVDVARAVASIQIGADETITETVRVADGVEADRKIFVFIEEIVDIQGLLTDSNNAEPVVLIDTVRAIDEISMQLSATNIVGCVATVTDSIFYNDPGRIAWLMNTETTAVWWYENYGFDSIVQTPDGVYACSEDGLYEISGDTDLGSIVTAEVKTGFNDFSNMHTKRVENIYFGYKSDGRLSVEVETYGSDHGPYTYFLEQRDAIAPRNSRVVPGKGLNGRYWRFTIKNVDGVSFTVEDAFMDLAISSRRV